ncbi:bifunctional uridylate/adenylate kinase [Coemansia javaensis]|uniref:Bifunctional uridylate/adenylate kinase n=1 Tax=Coemansia javaensis TaxID=2761396 RepID=A0A9W8H4L0_9FUNG|nr:bifunctional uridylate/adenylate kinase [Coemansia javaensis]
MSSLALLRARLAAAPARLSGRRGYALPRRARSGALQMGQSGGGGGSGWWAGRFRFNPLFLVGAGLSVMVWYKLSYGPRKAWEDQMRKEAEDRAKECAAAQGRHTEEAIAKFPFAQKSVVFVLGGPGSGKGTNSARLARDLGFARLSVGGLLREEQERSVSQHGELIGHYIHEGLPVPDRIVADLLRDAMMDRPECDWFLIDGFPRSLAQAKAFEDTVCQARKVLLFECPEETMLARLLDRGKTSGRSDDDAESIRKRFRTYANDAKPVIDAFAKEGKVLTVSCQGSVDDVYAKTRAQVAELLDDGSSSSSGQSGIKS